MSASEQPIEKPPVRQALRVVAGVILLDGKVLLARRLPGVHLAGFWEFPGGKVEPGEDDPTALARELKEELDLEVDVGQEILVVTHDYALESARIEVGPLVELHFRLVRPSNPRQTPRPLQAEELRWVALEELSLIGLPPADRPLIDLLLGDILH